MIFTIYPLDHESRTSLQRRLSYREWYRTYGYACPPSLEGLSRKERFHHVGLFLAYLSLSGKDADLSLMSRLGCELVFCFSAGVDGLPESLLSDIENILKTLDDANKGSSFGVFNQVLKQFSDRISFLKILKQGRKLDIQRLCNEESPFEKAFLIKPPHTGFFSYLEHITLGLYHAVSLGSTLYVDNTNWLYLTSLELILPYTRYLRTTHHLSAELNNFEKVDCDWLRTTYIVQKGASKQLLLSIKVWLYTRIYLYVTRCQSLSIDPKRNIYFIRAGDKLKHEGELASLDIYRKMICEDCDSLVLSDSRRLLQEIVPYHRLKECLQFNRYAPIDGAYLKSGMSCEDIMFKWKTMINCEHLYAMYDSNLANTAGLVRSSLYDNSIKRNRVFFSEPLLHI